MLDFVFLSDAQLIPEGCINFDIDPQSRIKACINAINEECPNSDFCVITGDLAHWGEESAYSVLRTELSALNMPYYLLVGNHDKRSCFRNVFPEHPTHESGFIHYTVDFPEARVICLDTLDEGKRSGRLCQDRLSWLESKLAGQKRVFLFMHHPPFRVGLACMDDDGLINSEEFLDAITPYKESISYLFFGHLHRAVSGIWNGIAYTCPPSLVHQTPFDFINPKPGYISVESPQFYRVLAYPDRVVIHHREFLESLGSEVPNTERKRYLATDVK